MGSSIASIITFLIVLGIMILVHEFGHFIVAKLLRVKVLVFSLGFPPTIYKKKWGETEYQIAAIPIGGYVKMLGESPGDTDDKIDPEELDRSYWAQSPIKRMAITAAGPFLNLVLAFLIAPISYMIEMEVPRYPIEPPVVQGIAPGSPADLAGFQYGDRILTVNGQSFDTWEKLDEFFYMNPNNTVNVRFKRNDDVLETSITLDAHEKYGLGISGFDMSETTVIDIYSEDSPARAAGLKTEDRIVAIARKPIRSFSSMKKVIQDAAPGSFIVEVIRDNKSIEIQIKPMLIKNGGGERYVIGVKPYIPLKKVRYGPIKAFKAGTSYLWDKAVGNIKGIGKLITGKLGLKAMSGPVGIGFIIGSARKAGLPVLIQITALISLILGIINFFPFPALDGGHIMFATMELVSRRKLNRKVVDFLNTAGLFLLLTLILLVTVQDIIRFREEILHFFRRLMLFK